MKGIYKLEAFALGLGFLGGIATGLYNIFILSNPAIPMNQLNLDIIYPAFFLAALYGYLLNTRNFSIRSIFFGTTFSLIANLFGFTLVFYLAPSQLYMPRFEQAFPDLPIVNVLMDISIGRLTWCFMLMLLAMAISAFRSRSTQQPAK
jgi:hypothetical protein